MATVFTETFETDGNGTRYTTSIPEFTDGFSDFFIRTDGSNIISSYNVFNSEGSFYFAAQDIDGEGAASQQTLTFSGIDITGFTNLNLSTLLAEDDASDGNQDWDAPDFVSFEYQIDSSGFTNLLAIENDGSTFNSAPFRDTDFDGTGDGTEVTEVFSTFSGAIAGTGSILDLRITFDLDSGDEDIAIDNIQITGDSGGGGGGTTLSIAATDANKTEGDAGTTPFTFTVTRSGDTTGTTSVDFAVSGDADAADFGGTLPSGTVNFADGETSQVVTVDVSGDTDSEPDENFTVTLSNPSGDETITTASANGTIENDDGVAITPIYDIQGARQTSPFVTVDFNNLPANTFSITGDSVATTGIVTAVDSNGFYLQDPIGDGDIATSDALFVFTGSNPNVSVGDALQVEGTVAEFFPGDTDTRNLPTTQISSPTITTLSTGNAVPDAVIIGSGGRVPPTENIDDDAFASFDPTTDGIDFFESLEAMRVTAQDTVAIAPTNRFGEIFTVVDNGVGATGISDRGTLNISPDDFNPEKVQIDEDSGVFDFDFPTVDTGDSLGDVTGVISYSFGNFEIIPTEDFTSNITSANLQPEVSSIVGSSDQLTVASYNVLNLDPNDNDGDTDVADGRFDTIASQIINNLNTPDVIGLQEVQDNNGSVNDGTVAADQTLQTLIDAIADAGGPEYEFIDNTFITDGASGGQPGGNIRTAFLYNPARVDLVEGSVQPIGDQSSGSAFEGARLPLVADFEFNGQEVTVISNHFSSKGGSAPILGIEQPFDERQEDVTVNGSLDERQAQANAVNDFVANTLNADPDANIVALGDFNEFEFVSPLEILEQNLTNLTETLPENERYSFIFQGNSQSLDHILVSDSLDEGAEFDVVQVNSEFAETEQRASDHDPLVARLTLETPVVEPNIIEGTRNADNITGTRNPDFITGNNGDDTINGRGDNDTIEGGRGGDDIRGAAGDDVLAADRVDRFDDFDGTFSRLRGGSGDDTIFGGSKDDIINGQADDDLLLGKGGHDLIIGNAGDDTLNGGVGNDTLRGGDGTDTADYSDLVIKGVFGTVAGLDINLDRGRASHSSTNNALTWMDVVTNVENVLGTQRNDRLIGDEKDNLLDGQGEVGRNDRQTTFEGLDGTTYNVTADVVEYQGNLADFSLAGTADNFTVTGSNTGTDTLTDIEFLKFDDGVFATSDLF
ncbi:hemolysin-type calcium-binding repeat family protein [Lyngbya aestuarii BL J]|uniref:Hemolysin-type calcium-binding repeat family protein n=1 Tax=Lyngbya aestuarii BL J TaxID=1348334 RepID=U7QFF3_9CYAN|nr:endonuclease/exonuclease/phosphatase family protein [Lyngbya aestuarii]ERT06679.1 hemolysin-type calcium-binding repeat family protein [Lyngbya aestuarii BL J]